jgi:hypothetical protein
MRSKKYLLTVVIFLLVLISCKKNESLNPFLYNIESIKVSKMENTERYSVFVVCNIVNNSGCHKLLKIRECYDYSFFTGYTNNDTIYFYYHMAHSDIVNITDNKTIRLVSISHIPNQTDNIFIDDLKSLKIKYLAPKHIQSLDYFIDSFTLSQTDSTRIIILENNIGLDVENKDNEPFPMGDSSG